MPATRHDMRDVALLEVDGAPGGADLSRGRAPSTDRNDERLPRDAARPFLTRRAGHRLIVALLVALALVGADLAIDARSRAAIAALADVPGVLAPIDGPVRELWRSDRALRPDLVAAGGLLAGVLSDRGSADVVGLDPATGTIVWRTLARPEGPGSGGVRCVAPDGPGSAPEPSSDPPVPLLVCVVDRAVPLRTESGTARAETADRLLTLDATTGEVLRERQVERSTSLAALGPDVVTAHVDAAGLVHVVRADPLGGAQRWEFVTPHRLPLVHPGWATRLHVVGDLVLLDESDGWVLSAGGEVVHTWATSPSAQLEGTADVIGGGRFLARPQADGGPWPRTQVTDLESGRTFVISGRPARPEPDDGSTAGRVLVRATGGALVALDPDSFRPVWSIPGSVQSRSMAVGGLLVRIGSTALSAVDAGTGEERWSTPLVRTARSSLVTDGRLAVVTALDPELGVVLTAYGLDDGRPRWRSDVADDIAVLTVQGGRLLGWTGEQVVALG